MTSEVGVSTHYKAGEIRASSQKAMALRLGTRLCSLRFVYPRPAVVAASRFAWRAPGENGKGSYEAPSGVTVRFGSWPAVSRKLFSTSSASPDSGGDQLATSPEIDTTEFAELVQKGAFFAERAIIIACQPAEDKLLDISRNSA